MKRITALMYMLLLSSIAFAKTFPVKNSSELEHANEIVQPGDVVVLQNGVWRDVQLKLTCNGTKNQPIVFKAQTPGKVIITGISSIKIGGNHLVVDGLLFEKGYAPGDAVIEFRIDSKKLANSCRVTNCVINNFNKPKRLDDDQWIALYGKNNRLDHCSFYNKKNMGVLLAVLLDDERSRENFHSIDHNFFGVRLPLASNGGEIIRVGLAQHALFNSNTQIKNNFFEDCDGEAEVISIKSCSNVISNNTFKKCQGSVVLRHGDNNTVVNNLFLGNGKEATGGVRIINKGQWVINNFFYQCRGQGFRAPLTIMNGVPNSPPTRYVQVTDAVVINNTFVDCAPMSLGEGSDEERTAIPNHVLFANNIFYNQSDTSIYTAWDSIGGMMFKNNSVSEAMKQKLVAGFNKTILSATKVGDMLVPKEQQGIDKKIIDSLQQLSSNRFDFSSFNYITALKQLAANKNGAAWFKPVDTKQQPVVVVCKTAADIYNAVNKYTSPLRMRLTGANYVFDKPVVISNKIEIGAATVKTISIATANAMDALFIIAGGGSLSLNNIRITAENAKANSFISTDTSGSTEHFSLSLKNVVLKNFAGCNNIFYAYKSTLADSIIVQNTAIDHFSNGFVLAAETDNKGYYNVEMFVVSHNNFTNGNGTLLSLYRGGPDESTLGPNLVFTNNKIEYCNTGSALQPLIQLTGIQKTTITGNKFSKSNPLGKLISYSDTVRAEHYLKANELVESGVVQKNQYVKE